MLAQARRRTNPTKREEDVEGFGELASGVIQALAAVVEEKDRHGIVFFDFHGAAEGGREGDVECGAGLLVGDSGFGASHELNPMEGRARQ